MKSITKIIIGLLGITAIGLVTFYVVTKERNVDVDKKGITNPSQETVATAKVIQDNKLEKIKKELNIDGEEFTLTSDEGVYTNSTNDKLLIIKEDIWKKILRKIQKKFPNIAEDCNDKYEMPNLSEYKFVGLLTYLANSKDIKTTIGYSAIEIRKGNAKYFVGGDICCDCDGEEAVSQQVDAVILK